MLSKTTLKPWGYEELLVDLPEYRIKRLVVLAGRRTSLQYHNHKVETMIFPDGRVVTYLPRVKHRLSAPKDRSLEVIEVSHGSDDDIVRVEDDYGRTPTVVRNLPI